MPFSVQMQDRTTLFLLTFLELALCVALVLTWWASTPSALRLPIELLHVRPRLDKALRKSKRLEGIIALLIFALSPVWEKEFLAPSIANAFDIVCHLDRDVKLDEAPQNKKQKVATGLLRNKLCEQDFAGPISVRASQVLGPVSRYRVADILHHMKLVSRASRPGLTVDVLRILCNGLCTAQRFHTEEHEHTCRVGCPNEPDSLSLTTTNALFCMICFNIFGDRPLCFH